MGRTKKIVLGAIGLVAIGVAGGAIAATQLDSPSARSAAIVTDAAGQLGVTPAALQNALVKAEEDQIESEVSSGQISQDQGNALKAGLESGALPVINTPGPGGGGGFRGGAGPFTDLSTAASFLGLSAQQIQADLQNGQTLADIAKAQGKTADDLISALVAAQKSKLDSAVSAGKLSSDQETKILSALQTQITNAVNNTQPTPGTGGGPGFGFRGSGPGPGGAFFMRGNIPAAASFLGLTNQQVMSDLKNGQTLADIAKAQGKTVDDLVAALVAAEKSNLDKSVSNGKLSSDQETRILANAQTQITNQVNGNGPGFAGPGGGHPGGPGFGRGGFGIRWGGGPGGTTTSTTTTSA